MFLNHYIIYRNHNLITSRALFTFTDQPRYQRRRRALLTSTRARRSLGQTFKNAILQIEHKLIRVSCGPVHTTREEFENEYSFLKAHQMFIFRQQFWQELEAATKTGRIGLVDEENSDRETIYYYRDVIVSEKCFPSTQ